MLPDRRIIWINDETVRNYTFASNRFLGDTDARDHSRYVAAKNDREKSGDPENETRFRTSFRTSTGISGSRFTGGNDLRKTSAAKKIDMNQVWSPAAFWSERKCKRANLIHASRRPTAPMAARC